MVRLNKNQQSFINMKSTKIEIKLGMPELPMVNVVVSEPRGSEVWDNTSESGVNECPHVSINRRRKRTECCGSVILRVIRMLGDIWRECIGCGLREEAGK